MRKAMFAVALAFAAILGMGSVAQARHERFGLAHRGHIESDDQPFARVQSHAHPFACHIISRAISTSRSSCA